MNFNRRLSGLGLFAIRAGIGFTFILHGWPKLAGGAKAWAEIGKAVGVFGIDFAPAFWGFMAGTSEFVGGLLLIAGFGTRVAASFMLMTMIVATGMTLSKGGGFAEAAHPIELGIVFLGLILIGSGPLSLDALIWRRRP